MSELTVAELIELLQNESASIDMQFQLWISVTFAVIIASFAARSHFTTSLKLFVTTLYALAATALTLRYTNDASQFVFLKAELTARAVNYPSVADLKLLRTLIYVLGSLATVVFVFLNPRSQSADQAPQSSM